MSDKTIKIRKVIDTEVTMTYDDFVELRSSKTLRKCKVCDIWFDASKYLSTMPTNNLLQKCVMCYMKHKVTKKNAEGERFRDKQNAKKRQDEWDSA